MSKVQCPMSKKLVFSVQRLACSCYIATLYALRFMLSALCSPLSAVLRTSDGVYPARGGRPRTFRLLFTICLIAVCLVALPSSLFFFGPRTSDFGLSYSLVQLTNFPNPFDSRVQNTTLDYYLWDDSSIELRIYDALGGLVKTYAYNPGQTPGGQAGPCQVVWDGTDENGYKVAKGSYICSLKVSYEDATFKTVRKIAVLH